MERKFKNCKHLEITTNRNPIYVLGRFDPVDLNDYTCQYKVDGKVVSEHEFKMEIEPLEMFISVLNKIKIGRKIIIGG